MFSPVYHLMYSYLLSPQSSYSQLLAATTLTRLISKSSGLTVEQRLHIRKFKHKIQVRFTFKEVCHCHALINANPKRGRCGISQISLDGAASFYQTK